MPATATANERFKQSYGSSFWLSLTIATVFHAAVLAGSPAFALEADDRPDPGPMVVVPPEVTLPEPPPPIRPPAAPVISAAAPAAVTLDPVTPEEWKQRALEPPPASDDSGAGIPFTPMEIAPRLLNSAGVQRTLLRQYPPLLRDARVGGTVSVWLHIDAEGQVLETRVHRSSGYDPFDLAALAVARTMEFSPAYNRDRKVPVWVSVDITFEVRE